MPCSHGLRPTARPGPTGTRRRLATDVAAFIEGAHLLWLLDRDEVDLTAVHRSYFEDRRLA